MILEVCSGRCDVHKILRCEANKSFMPLAGGVSPSNKLHGPLISFIFLHAAKVLYVWFSVLEQER
jgi:hypothetical protein